MTRSARRHLVQMIAPCALFLSAAGACTAEAPVERLVDLALWGLDMDSSGALDSPAAVGDLEVRFHDEAAVSWSGDQSSTRLGLQPPARGYFVAASASRYGASREVSVEAGTRRYRSLYLGPADALLCHHLAGATRAGRESEAARLQVGGNVLPLRCSWYANTLRFDVEGASTGELWVHFERDSQIVDQQASFVDGSAQVILSLDSNTPGEGLVRLELRDAMGGALASWPSLGDGRALLLPSLLDAVQLDERFAADAYGDNRADVDPGGQLSFLQAGYIETGELSIELGVLDDTINTGTVDGDPAHGSFDAVRLTLADPSGTRPATQLTVDRNGDLAPGSIAAEARSELSPDGYRLFVSVPLDELALGELGKGSLLQLCVEAFVAPAVGSARLADTAWPQDCQSIPDQRAIVRLFQLMR